MLAIGVFWVMYQRTFGYSHGLDSMTPEFDSVWMGLWRFNIIGNAIFFVVSVGWIWMTRDRNLANLDPKLELRRYFYWLSWLVCYIWGVYYAGSYTLEQDAAWHQVIIRDTSFTASHIVAFYGSFPLVHHVWCIQLSVCADAIAAVRPGDVVPIGGGGGGADDDSAERGVERVGPCVLVCR